MICGGVLLLIDAFIFVLCFCWWRWKKKERERKLNNPEYVPLFRTISSPPTTPVTTQTNISEFAIPILKPLEKKSKHEKLNKKPLNLIDSGLDPLQYSTGQRITLKNKPKVGFQFFYDFRSTQLKITLVALQNITKFMNEQMMVTILMSNTKVLYHSSKVEGPDAIFNEEYPFPLDSMEISLDPPITAKFNIWHVDRQSKKRPFGFVQVKIEDILTQMNNITPDQGKTVWRNVVTSDHLTDEGLKGELLITLSYLSAAQRISCTIVKAKDLILTANDKDMFVKITLLCRDEEQQCVVTNFTEITQNPEFNREFIFRFEDLRNSSIDGVSLRFDVMAREIGLLRRDRTLGSCVIGNSNIVERPGKEHWVSCLTSPKSVTQWHQLKEI